MNTPDTGLALCLHALVQSKHLVPTVGNVYSNFLTYYSLRLAQQHLDDWIENDAWQELLLEQFSNLPLYADALAGFEGIKECQWMMSTKYPLIPFTETIYDAWLLLLCQFEKFATLLQFQQIHHVQQVLRIVSEFVCQGTHKSGNIHPERTSVDQRRLLVQDGLKQFATVQRQSFQTIAERARRERQTAENETRIKQEQKREEIEYRLQFGEAGELCILRRIPVPVLTPSLVASASAPAQTTKPSVVALPDMGDGLYRFSFQGRWIISYKPRNFRQYLSSVPSPQFCSLLKEFGGTSLLSGMPKYACGNCEQIFEESDKDKLSTCSICLSMSYCNRACQKSHWRVHRNDCPVMCESKRGTV